MVDVDLLAFCVRAGTLGSGLESLLECESPVLKLALDRLRRSLRNEGMVASSAVKRVRNESKEKERGKRGVARCKQVVMIVCDSCVLRRSLCAYLALVNNNYGRASKCTRDGRA